MIFHFILLIIATAIWGFGFVAARWALAGFDPYWTHALRFLIAGSLCFPFLLYKKSFTRKNHILKESFIASIYLFGILFFQTVGLYYTSVAKSGFITTLYTLFIPMISIVLYKKKYSKMFWFLLFSALFGVALMCNLNIHELNRGDFLTLICAISGAFHIYYVGAVVHKVESSIEFNFLQNFFIGIFSIVAAFIFSGELKIESSTFSLGLPLYGLLFLGIISSMISFTIQIVAQKKIPDHLAGLIFLLESPFAALFGFLVLGEVLNGMNLVGAFLILASVSLTPFLTKKETALNN